MLKTHITFIVLVLIFFFPRYNVAHFCWCVFQAGIYLSLQLYNSIFLYWPIPLFFVTVGLIKQIQLLRSAEFNQFVNSTLTSLKASNKLNLTGRFQLPTFLSKVVDIVLSHQWGNPLNYLYFDVMYAGYPLVHNSPYLQVHYFVMVLFSSSMKKITTSNLILCQTIQY